MCNVGGSDFEFDVETLEADRYRCNNCGNKFDGLGEKIICPSCRSENVAKV